MNDDVVTAQQRLGSMLERAQTEEDRDLARLVREQGAGFSASLNALLRTAHTHALNNAAFDAPVRDFGVRLAALLELLGPVHLICVEDQIYLNDLRIRFDAMVEATIVLPGELRRHNTGGLTFFTPLEEQEIRDLIRLLAGPAAGELPRTSLQSELAAARMSTVELHPPQQFRITGEELPEVNQSFREVYLASVGVVAEAFASLGAGRLPSPLQARRIVTHFVDAARSDDTANGSREADELVPGFSRHTLMVTNLSVLIGRAIGLSNPSLADLGVAAVFHDIGFSLTEEGYTVPFERHNRAGLKVLLRQRGFYLAKIRRLLAVLQHHRPLDGPHGTPALYARIIHVADDFDILTRYRPGRGPICSIPDAVARMAAQGARAYDPDLLQAFLNEMGPFPPGSLLRLEDGRTVVSVSAVRSTETFDRPLCRVIRNADGSPAADRPELDLAQEGRITGILRPTG